MSERSGIRRFFRLPSSPRTVARDIDEEIAFHIEARTSELVAAGVSPDEARCRAEHEFGDVAAARSELASIDRVTLRRERRAAGWDALLQDTRIALRSLRRSPAFTLTVVLTLALGIGVNAAMFGITDRLLLSAPPHVANGEALVRVLYEYTPGEGPQGGERVVNANFPYPDYGVLRSVEAFSEVGAFFVTSAVLGRGERAAELRLALATASFFPLLGVQPVLGRFFTEAEDRVPRGERVVVLSHALWQDLFGGDAAVVGSTVEIDHSRYEVVGVAPRGFNGVNLEPVHAWVPVSAVSPDMAGDEWYDFRGMHYLQVVARLRAGVSEAVARAQASAVFVAANEPRFAGDSTAKVLTGSVVAARAPAPTGGGTPQRSGRIALWLLGVSLLVVAIACMNVINLLLARAMRQRREVGVRLALGMGRGRLVAQAATESLLIALLGAASGLLLAHWGGHIARAALLPDVEWAGSPVTGRVVAFTVGIALACALFATLAPALHSARGHVTALLGPGGRSTYRTSRLRTGLVALQAMLSVLLLVGAGLFLRSMHETGRIALGFDQNRVAAVTWHTSGLEWEAERVLSLYNASLERVRALPHVETAALSVTEPLWSRIYGFVRLPGIDSVAGVREVIYSSVSADYFRTMGTRMLQGRPISDADVHGSPAVAVVSETLARLLWPHENAVGRCFMTSTQPDAPCREVVGVVEDIRYSGVLDEPSLMYYLPLAQAARRGTMRSLLVRFSGDPASGIGAVRTALHALEPGLPYVRATLLRERVAPALMPWRLGAAMFTAFGVLALFLATLGLYGVVAYDVAQRRRELGVRVALGARAATLLRMVLGHAARVVILGLLVGMAIAGFGARWIQPLLFEVSARDPAVHAAVAALLLVIALCAAALPAWRAARVQPTEALRDD
jgi:putative ABC transport system permease protein